MVPTPLPLFQTAAHGHHIILFSLLCETCWRPSPCHEKAASSEGFGAEQSVPNSLGTPICLGLSQKEHPPTTSSVRDTRCMAPAAHLPLGGECAGGRSLFPAQCTHMAARTHKRHWSHSLGFAAKVFQESCWSQNSRPSSAVCGRVRSALERPMLIENRDSKGTSFIIHLFCIGHLG